MSDAPSTKNSTGTSSTEPDEDRERDEGKLPAGSSLKEKQVKSTDKTSEAQKAAKSRE